MPGGIGAPCETNDHCKDPLWCDSTLCDHKWSGGFCAGLCESDEDCVTIEGKAQKCRADPSNTQFSCMWICESDADCPATLGVTFSCGGEHLTYKTCQRACEE